MSMRSQNLCMLFLLMGFTLNAQAKLFSFQSHKMGTEFNIKIYGIDTVRMNQAVSIAWLKIDSLNTVFSDYSSTSEVARLHQDASDKFFTMSPDFAHLMKVSLGYSRLSKGAFDVSVGALSKIWRRAIKLNEMPDSTKIQEALHHVGYKQIILRRNKIKIPIGMRLDFGAIAKGYAVDAAYQVLLSRGYPVSLVDGGGDIYCGQSPPMTQGWEIATSIKNILGQWIDSTVFVHDAAIVTSGDAYKFIEDDQGHRYSHIINPHTGYGIPGPHLTTVIAANAMHADALATTLSILPFGEINKIRKKWHRTFPDLSSTWDYRMYKNAAK